MILKTLCRISVNFIGGMLMDATTLDVQWAGLLKPNSFKIAEAMMYEHQLVYTTQGGSQTYVNEGLIYDTDQSISTSPDDSLNADMIIALKKSL